MQKYSLEVGYLTGEEHQVGLPPSRAELSLHR